MLIEAFAQAGLPGSLVIMGEGPLRGALEARIMQLGLEGRVHLPGFLENPFAVLKRASLFALPSNAAGFPNGLVEAMACGLPVVAANCEIGREHVCTPVTTAHLVCRLLLEQNTYTTNQLQSNYPHHVRINRN